MRHYFQSTCTECRSHADGLDNTRKAGDHYIGGRFTIRTVREGENDGARGSELSDVVTFDITSLEAVDGNNKFRNADPAHNGLQSALWLAWRNDAWTVVYTSPP
ncbi:MAG: hypothetical protein ABI232_06055 [Jatrophihabitantaceae bacterium]